MNTMTQTDIEDAEHLGRPTVPVTRSFTVEASTITKAIGTALRSTDTRNTIPILAGAHLSWVNGVGIIVGTDMEIAATVSFPVKGGAGACVVPASGLYDAVRRLPPSASVSVAQASEDADLVVTSGRFRASLKTLPIVDFPQVNAGAFPCRFAIPAATLRDLIESVRFAASTQETRHYLCGAYLHIAEGKLRAVATDRGMLGMADCDLPEGAVDMHGIIIPTSTLAEILKTIDGAADDVTVEVSTSRVRVACGAVTITSKIIDGTFPDYQRVIPRGNDIILLAPKAELARIVETVAPFSESGQGSAGKSAVFALDMTLEGTTISSYGGDKGSASDAVDGGEYTGSPLRIGLLARPMLAIFGALGERVSLAFSDASGPIVITDPDRAGLLYVMMPFRI
jgi:DNA polymerase-3 subunit beta